MTRFYLDSQSGNWNGNTCSISDFEFGAVAGEPDALVSSISATYNGTNYEVVFSAPKSSTVSQYQVRYGTQSMHSSGFGSGTDGGLVNTTGNTFTAVLWTSPPMAEASMLYVAIQPPGQTLFTEVAIPAMRDPLAGPTGEPIPPTQLFLQ